MLGLGDTSHGQCPELWCQLRDRALLLAGGRDWGSPAHILLSLQVQPPDPASIRVLRGHQLPITCLVISPDDRFIFSASKDGALIKCKCSLGAATGCLPSLNPGRDPAAAGPQVPMEVPWSFQGHACAPFWALWKAYWCFPEWLEDHRR